LLESSPFHDLDQRRERRPNSGNATRMQTANATNGSHVGTGWIVSVASAIVSVAGRSDARSPGTKVAIAFSTQARPSVLARGTAPTPQIDGV
jgi:hypothetical protein